jgi:hypothetical protein
MKQGAKPEELVTKPSDRKEDAPSWVSQVGQEPAAPKIESMPEPQAEAPGWLNDVAQTLDREEQPAAPKADDTLAWLSDLEKQAPQAEEPLWAPVETPAPESVASGGDISDWLKSLDEKQESEPDRHEMDVHVDASAIVSSDVPDWLKSMDEKGKAPAGDDLPDWLKDQTADDRITPEPQTISSEWIPAEGVSDRSASATSFALPEEFHAESESHLPDLDSEPPLKAPASLKFDAPPPKPEPRAPKPKPSAAVVTGDRDGPVLKKAQEELTKHNLGDAMAEYSRLIKKGKLLEEVIYDLREATYKHPVDVIVWQTLGDAYMRSNRLQDALDSYTKAEELLR